MQQRPSESVACAGPGLVMEGRSRIEAARAAGMDRQTLRDWDRSFGMSLISSWRVSPNHTRPSVKRQLVTMRSIAAWLRAMLAKRGSSVTMSASG